jgi:hypothetical protein
MPDTVSHIRSGIFGGNAVCAVEPADEIDVLACKATLKGRAVLTCTTGSAILQIRKIFPKFVRSIGRRCVLMTTKLAPSKDEAKEKLANTLSPKSVVKKPVKSPSSRPVAGKSLSPVTSAKPPTSKKRVYSDETVKVLRDADAGKNLLHYASAEEMFKDLGI